MSSVLAPNSNRNLAMPRGRISFAKMDSNGTMKGEVDLGNCLALDLTQKFGYKDHMTARGPFTVLDASLIAQMEMDLKITPEERSRENMALFFLGDPDAQKAGGAGNLHQAAGHIPAQAFVPYLDRWVDLGKRLIKTGTIEFTKQGGGKIAIPGTLTADEYRVDYENGLFMFKSANQESIVDELAGMTVEFHYGRADLPKFVQGTDPVIGFLRYVGTSAVGPRHSVKLWKVQIFPDTALKLLDAANIAGLSFSGKVFIDDDAGSHPDLPFGEQLELIEAAGYPS